MRERCERSCRELSHHPRHPRRRHWHVRAGLLHPPAHRSLQRRTDSVMPRTTAGSCRLGLARPELMMLASGSCCGAPIVGGRLGASPPPSTESLSSRRPGDAGGTASATCSGNATRLNPQAVAHHWPGGGPCTIDRDARPRLCSHRVRQSAEIGRKKSNAKCVRSASAQKAPPSCRESARYRVRAARATHPRRPRHDREGADSQARSAPPPVGPHDWPQRQLKWGRACSHSGRMCGEQVWNGSRADPTPRVVRPD